MTELCKIIRISFLFLQYSVLKVENINGNYEFIIAPTRAQHNQHNLRYSCPIKKHIRFDR